VRAPGRRPVNGVGFMLSPLAPWHRTSPVHRMLTIRQHPGNSLLVEAAFGNG
jgi:hypothetical protein